MAGWCRRPPANPSQYILLIDDDDLFRSSACLHFRRLGHTVVDASTGGEGCRLAANQHFDFIVVDMLMGDMDGIETIVELRRTAPGCRILAISGGGRIIGASHPLYLARRLGADDVLAKPFTFEGLLIRGERLLTRNVISSGHSGTNGSPQ